VAEPVSDGSARLGQDVAAARRSKAAPLVGLENAAERYIAVAHDSPALFRPMFSRALVDLPKYPEARREASVACARLVLVVGAVVPPDAAADLSVHPRTS